MIEIIELIKVALLLIEIVLVLWWLFMPDGDLRGYVTFAIFILFVCIMVWRYFLNW